MNLLKSAIISFSIELIIEVQSSYKMDNPPQAISTETEKELEEEDINFEETEKLR